MNIINALAREDGSQGVADSIIHPGGHRMVEIRRVGEDSRGDGALCGFWNCRGSGWISKSRQLAHTPDRGGGYGHLHLADKRRTAAAGGGA